MAFEALVLQRGIQQLVAPRGPALAAGLAHGASGAGIDNPEYRAERYVRAKVDKGEVPRPEFLVRSADLVRLELERLLAERKKAGAPAAPR